MSVPMMPPRPDEWGSLAPSPIPERPSTVDRPPWRQGRPGWALLHLLIGVGVWFVGLMAMGVVLASAGRTQADFDAVGDNQGGIVVFFLAASLAGWILFAYTAGSLARRWAIFGCVAGGGWLIMIAVLLDATT